MKQSLTIFLIISIAALVASKKDHRAKWSKFKNDHKKEYNHIDDSIRMENFLRVDSEIEKHNARDQSDHGYTYKKGHNHLSDKTEAEKQAMLGTVLPESVRSSIQNEYPSVVELMDRAALPATLDYRNTTPKCVGPVKNQGSCGSCWAFSAIAPLEYSYCKKQGGYVSLSEQQMVDCDKTNGGCGGGWPARTWAYLKSVGGSEATTVYPYTAKNGVCQFNVTKALAKVSKYGSVAPKNVTAMKTALVTYGPLSVAIWVNSNFQQYKSGIYADSTCPTNGAVNHGVNVVGYGSNYWIVRNSWGAGWGEAGYMRMAMGVNMCSIETYPTFVVAV